MSDDDDVRGLESRVERRDELLLARSIHWILSDRRLTPCEGRSRLVAPAAPASLKARKGRRFDALSRMRQSRRRYRLEPMQG